MEEHDRDSIQEDMSSVQENDSKTVNVGSGVRVEGRIEGAEVADISGTLSGTLKSSNIHISDSGNFNGDMSGQDITIAGNVEGDINSEDHIIVNQSANIKGTIEYSSLQVSYGAKIQGTLRHRGSVQSYTPDTNNFDQDNEVDTTNHSQEEES
tara:strand:- start:182 stop:640 length:459 start_codon:yes stop_codon:yes gene_type:complete